MTEHQYAKAFWGAKSDRNEARHYCKHAAAKTKRESKRELARAQRRYARMAIEESHIPTDLCPVNCWCWQ